MALLTALEWLDSVLFFLLAAVPGALGSGLMNPQVPADSAYAIRSSPCPIDTLDRSRPAFASRTFSSSKLPPPPKLRPGAALYLYRGCRLGVTNGPHKLGSTTSIFATPSSNSEAVMFRIWVRLHGVSSVFSCSGMQDTMLFTCPGRYLGKKFFLLRDRLMDRFNGLDVFVTVTRDVGWNTDILWAGWQALTRDNSPNELWP